VDVFVVRVVADPAGDQAAPGLRGIVEHVATGSAAPFREPAELVAFMQIRAAERETPRQTAQPA
jgi:hypothetical protein